MSDVKDSMMKEPYPFVNARYMEKFIGSTVALVGKIDKAEASNLIVRTSDEKEVAVVNYRSHSDMILAPGSSVEIRGVVTKDLKLNFSDINKFEGDFDFNSFE